MKSNENNKDVIGRFQANIHKNSGGCWDWNGPVTSKGRGRLSING